MPQAQVKRQDKNNNNKSNNDEVKGITLKHDEFFRTNLFCPLLMSFILENKCKKKKINFTSHSFDCCCSSFFTNFYSLTIPLIKHIPKNLQYNQIIIRKLLR